MYDEADLRDFENVCKLFPLPKVVLFPHVVLPLHIFEARYRQMTGDALAGDQLIAIVQLDPGPPATTLGVPPVAEVACLGRILQHERLPDGRFNLLLAGLKRVRLTREVQGGKLYRIAEASIMEDEDDGGSEEPRREELVGLFRRAFEQRGPLAGELNDLLGTSLPLGILTDIMAHALGLPPDVSQLLLAETSVGRRVVGLLEILCQVLGAGVNSTSGARPFPPTFSAN